MATYKLSISYISFLLLAMPATKAGVAGTAALLILGLALIIYWRPQIRVNLRGNHFLASVFSAGYLGYCFYCKWLPSSKVSRIAGLLHLTTPIFLSAVTIILSLSSMLIIVWALQKTTDKLETEQAAIDAMHPVIDVVFRCFVVACITVALPQMMLSVGILSMRLLRFVCAVAIVMIATLLFEGLCGNIRISALLGTCGVMILATVSTYVHQFRGRLVEPIDVFSIGTAMNVADHYSLWPIPLSVVLCWGLWYGAIFILFPKKPEERHRISGKVRIIIIFCCILAAIPVSRYAFNVEAYHWSKEGAVRNGCILDFISKIKEAIIVVPDGYSREEIEALAEQYPQKTDNSQTHSFPHIIVIMDESFCDLSVDGDLFTDVEVTPFISSLRQDAVSGDALVSVFGGNTANSEFEFLTGNTMAWLSPNAVPYQQYLKTPAYSMVSYLKSNFNYRCIAMHPYYSSGWNRTIAYENLGFDDCLFLEEFPQKDLIRGFVSDQEMMEKVVDIYKKQHESPLFLFGVTIQNHGGYLYKGDDYTASVSLTGYDGDYPDAEQYLSLIHETDKAIESLIAYFSDVDDDVVIVFFGDHQPKLDMAFFDELGRRAETSLDEQQKRYLVPFFIWANYDIEEKQLDKVSLNYLSTYVYEVAGISLPPLNQFLSDMEVIIPAINANGFYSLDEKCYRSFDKASPEESVWLEKYQYLQYNNLFETQGRNEVFFPR